MDINLETYPQFSSEAENQCDISEPFLWLNWVHRFELDKLIAG